MRLILKLCILGGAIFAGYWAISAHLITRYAPDMLAQSPRIAAQQGQVEGFPLAFRTELENLNVESRDQAFVWQVPRITLEAASYLPNRIQATVSPRHSLSYLGNHIDLTHEGMQAELVVDHLLRVSMAAFSLSSATATPGFFLREISSLNATLQSTEAESYRLDLSAQGLHLAPELRRILDPMDSHPEQITHSALHADLVFDGPLALNRPTAQLRQITIHDMQLDWGALTVSGHGQLQRAESGGLDGTLSLGLQDWRVLHAMLVQSGALDPDAAMMAGFFLGSQAEPGGTAIELVFNVTGSVIAFGPFILGQLPPL
ncbi:MAG: DUF2125 domain-containing protein [Roseinatronobacter sp.]